MTAAVASGSRRRATWARRSVVLVLTAGAAGLVLTSCVADPDPAPAPSASATASPAPDGLDADEEELATQVAALRATVAAISAELEAAAGGDQAALERAGSLLAADLDAARDPAVARAADQVASAAPRSRLAPLLPGPVVSRATTVSYGDLLTTTLAAARSAGGAGEPVARFLATPLAGDLGSWQRGPADLLALVGDAGTTSDIDRATAAVLALDGEAPRALAWVVHGLETDTSSEEAASRARAHLAIIERALEDLS